MSIILAVECSTLHPSVALLRDGVVVAESTWSCAGRGEPDRLWVEIVKIMKTCAVSLSDVSRYAVGLGPGNFTGLRTSLAAVQAFALPSKTPITGIGSAAAIAAGIQHDTPSAMPLLIVGDARRNRIWIAGLPPGSVPVRVVSMETAAQMMLEIPERVIASPDWDRLAVVLERIVPPVACLLRENRIPKASVIGQLALEGKASDGIEPLEPIYLHPPVFIAPRFTESLKRPLQYQP